MFDDEGDDDVFGPTDQPSAGNDTDSIANMLSSYFVKVEVHMVAESNKIRVVDGKGANEQDSTKELRAT
nr:hypothetical protein [Tanacetum cinerariifolium]